MRGLSHIDTSTTSSCLPSPATKFLFITFTLDTDAAAHRQVAVNSVDDLKRLIGELVLGIHFIPEPSTALLFAGGLLGLSLRRRLG